MTARLKRMRNKYFQRDAWARWWRSPYGEIYRFEWNWFRNSHLRKKGVRTTILLILLLNLGSSLLMSSFVWGQVGFIWIGMLSWLLMTVLLLDVMQRRFSLYFGPQTITDLYMSRIRPQRLWPAVLLSPFLLIAIIESINFMVEFTMNSLIAVGIMDMGIWASMDPSMAGYYRAQQIAGTLTGLLSLSVELAWTMAVIAMVAWHCALRPGWLHLFLRLIFSYIILGIIVGVLVILPLQLTNWWTWDFNSDASMFQMVIISFFESSILLFLMLLILMLIWRSMLRRLRGPKFHKKYLAALGKASG